MKREKVKENRFPFFHTKAQRSQREEFNHKPHEHSRTVGRANQLTIFRGKLGVT